MPQSYWRFCNPSVADIRQHDRVHDQRWGDIPNAPDSKMSMIDIFRDAEKHAGAILRGMFVSSTRL